MSRRRKIVAAVVLWLVFAFLIWNAIFDRIIVLAGRRYSYDAVTRFRASGTYLHIDDVMRPAIRHGVWVASLAAGAITVVALVLIRLATVRGPKNH